MTSACTHCSQAFEITDSDLAFYEKVSPVIAGKRYDIPPPTLCPDCRFMHLTSFRNEHSLHHNTCAKTGKSIISLYRPNSGVTVYENDVWWDDDWDAKSYGKDFDFSRSFFEQFEELWKSVPKMARIQQGENVNSQFTNTCSNNKNCYLIFSANSNEDCYYGSMIDRSKNCIDCQTTVDSELCLECINVERCYDCQFCQDSFNCSNSLFLKSCISCRNCFGCINLQNKEYCIMNEPHSKQEYEKKMKELRLNNAQMLKQVREEISTFFLRHPHRFYQGVQNENISGNYITNSKNALLCFDVDDIEDCKYCVGLRSGRDAQDVYHYGCTGLNELLYMCEAVGHGAVRTLFSKLIWGGSSDVILSYECFAVKNCFGCAGLRHQEYCILNKQYTKDEYEILVPKIIDHMKRTLYQSSATAGSSTGQEWGQFFPISMSPFGYNETYAHDMAPLTKEQALKQGWKWLEEPSATDHYLGPKTEVPETYEGTEEELSQRIFLCDGTKKPFKILPKEYIYYKDHALALPLFCPAERHRQRIERRNPFRLWLRNCAKCSKEIQTTYAPERPEIVYCERCYLETVY